MHAGMMCEPVGALVIGALSGVLSVLGYKYLTVMKERERENYKFQRRLLYYLFIDTSFILFLKDSEFKSLQFQLLLQ